MKPLARGLAPRGLHSLFHDGVSTGLTDKELLDRFASSRDTGGELAFAALVVRHGPMVLSVCRRMLQDPHESEDAFQATFLILVRKGPAVRFEASLGPWLYGVSVKVARRVAQPRHPQALDRTRRLDRRREARATAGFRRRPPICHRRLPCRVAGKLPSRHRALLPRRSDPRRSRHAARVPRRHGSQPIGTRPGHSQRTARSGRAGAGEHPGQCRGPARRNPCTVGRRGAAGRFNCSSSGAILSRRAPFSHRSNANCQTRNRSHPNDDHRKARRRRFSRCLCRSGRLGVFRSGRAISGRGNFWGAKLNRRRLTRWPRAILKRRGQPSKGR